MKKLFVVLITAGLFTGCATKNGVPARLMPSTEADEAAYAPYLGKGAASLSGQAFLVQRGGGTVKAAGRMITLDPATPIGDDWWRKAGRVWTRRYEKPGSKAFGEARRTAKADADGRFIFVDLPAGTYYLRTELTWEVPFHGTQGGVLGSKVVVREGAAETVVLNEVAN